ncbi:MAG: prepilin-type N-terminal cleavage/methylation domain-containing protein [Candidatus Omnitrophica bacterium]|nr:prepilin-type N-terminal cleavage/methylation domain-containing protein [Candidatus Omnitrophota bacterium]
MALKDAFKDDGFTFVELLIAVTIFATVAIALYSAFFAGVQVWKRSNEGGDIYQSARYTFEDFSKDLRNSIYMKKSSGEEESIYDFVGTSDEIIFFTLDYTLNEEGKQERELVRVSYKYDEDAGQIICVRAGPDLGFDLEKGEQQILVDGVTKFAFKYAYAAEEEEDEYDWKEEWVQAEKMIPRGVKCECHIESELEKEGKDFTKTVFLPLGVLGEEEFKL